MTKIACKGTALQLEVASVYTAVAQLISLDLPDHEVLNYDSTTLDGGTGKSYDPTEYVEGGSFSGEIFYDPALAIHKSWITKITTPAKANLKVVYSDTGASELAVKLMPSSISPFTRSGQLVLMSPFDCVDFARSCHKPGCAITPISFSAAIFLAAFVIPTPWMM